MSDPLEAFLDKWPEAYELCEAAGTYEAQFSILAEASEMIRDLRQLRDQLQNDLSAATKRAEELQAQNEQGDINVRWLIGMMDEAHDAMRIEDTGTWQQRMEQVVEKAEEEVLRADTAEMDAAHYKAKADGLQADTTRLSAERDRFRDAAAKALAELRVVGPYLPEEETKVIMHGVIEGINADCPGIPTDEFHYCWKCGHQHRKGKCPPPILDYDKAAHAAKGGA